MRDRLIEVLNNIQTVGTKVTQKKDIYYGKYIDEEDFSNEQVAEYLLANGVIVPPCKVGDKVWLIKSLNWQQTEWEIKEGKISIIQQKADKSWKFRVTENHSVKDYTVEKIGKTVFLTREEAEKALAERSKG